MDIRFERVFKAYDGRPVLRGLDWRVRDGERWRVDGPSGIGKTTLLRLAMRLETPDEGKIRGLLAVRVTACFQEQRLCPWLDAVQNVRLVCTEAPSEDALRVALGELLPAVNLSQPAGTLSGGMQRRVALARALLAPGDLVLLDEPFAGLDEANVAQALAFIDRHLDGRACVLVSHGLYTLPGEVRTLHLK